METLKIMEIAEACGGIMTKDGVITSICTDSRNIEPKCLFIALEGERFDGHVFAEQALKDGASAVMCHKPVDCDSVIQVADTRKSLLELAGYYRRKFTIPAAGITGSVGKTTTKEMIHLVLSQKYKTLKNEGNLNNEIGLPLTIFRLDHSFQAAVFEMGMSGFGEISVLSKASAPTVGIITNIGVSHIEHLGSRENILKAKLEILDGMADGAPLILNGDDEYLCNVKLDDRPVFFYGIHSDNCRFKCENIVMRKDETDFDILFDGNMQTVTIPTIGSHNIYNALASFAVGTALGVGSQAAAYGLKQYVPAGMRQKIVKVNGVTVIEDCYNASPDSIRAALNTLASIRANKRIAVLGDMLELGEYSKQAHYDVGGMAAQSGIDKLFLYGKEALYYAEGAKESGLSEALIFEDKTALAEALLQELESGDAVLFKASRGMKLEEAITSLYEGWNKN